MVNRPKPSDVYPSNQSPIYKEPWKWELVRKMTWVQNWRWYMNEGSSHTSCIHEGTLLTLQMSFMMLGDWYGHWGVFRRLFHENIISCFDWEEAKHKLYGDGMEVVASVLCSTSQQPARFVLLKDDVSCIGQPAILEQVTHLHFLGWFMNHADRDITHTDLRKFCWFASLIRSKLVIIGPSSLGQYLGVSGCRISCSFHHKTCVFRPADRALHSICNTCSPRHPNMFRGQAIIIPSYAVVMWPSKQAHK